MSTVAKLGWKRGSFMKRSAMVGAICASFLWVAALAAVGQDEHKDERPNATQDRQEQPRQQEQAKPEDRHDKTPPSEGRQQQEPQGGDRHMPGKPANQEHGQAAQGQQRRIPDKDFHAHFGQPHRFAVGHLQTYQGRPSFVYSGYTFVLVQAWPAGWVYDDDDCYIDYVDGDYWLFNMLYPGVRVELFIVG